MTAKDEGKSVVRDLVAAAAREGAVAYDIDQGHTLVETVRWLIDNSAFAETTLSAPGPHDLSTVPAALEEEDRESPLIGLLDADDRLAIASLEQQVSSETTEWVRLGLREYLSNLKNTEVPTWPGMSTTWVTQVVRASLSNVNRMVKGEPVSFLDDLVAYCSGLSDRDRYYVFARLGVTSITAPTLESLGAETGVTRERVRQITKRFWQRAALWSPPLGVLAITASAGRACGHLVTSLEWFQKLPVRLRPEYPFQMAVMSDLIGFGWFDGLKTAGSGIWLLEDDPRIAEPGEVKITLARSKEVTKKHLSRFGAVDLKLVEEEAGEDGPGLAHALLSAKDRCPVVAGWLVPKHRSKSALRTRVAKALSVARSLTMVELRAAIVRSLGHCPPDTVLAILLERDLRLTIDANRVRVTATNVHTVSLAPSEELALRIIADNGGAMTVKDLQRHLVEQGMSAGIGTVIAGRSPVLTRLGRGIVGIIGQPIKAGVIEQLQKRVKAETAGSCLGFRRLSGNRVEISYYLDPALLSSTTFSLPKGIVEEGRWCIQGNDSSEVAVKKGYVAGIHQFVEPVLDGSAGRVSLTFDRVAKAILIGHG